MGFNFLHCRQNSTVRICNKIQATTISQNTFSCELKMSQFLEPSLWMRLTTSSQQRFHALLQLLQKQSDLAAAPGFVSDERAYIGEKANKLLWLNVQLSQFLVHWCVCAGGEVSWCKERLLSLVVKMRLSVNRAKWFGFCLPPQAGVRWSTTPGSTVFLLPGSWNIIGSN